MSITASAEDKKSALSALSALKCLKLNGKGICLKGMVQGKQANKEFSKALEKRTLEFAVRIIRLSALLPNAAEGKVIKNQLTKSGTSIGANYREANRSRSRADFKNKIKICESEASETQYWLEIIEEAGMLPSDQLREVSEECAELVALFTSISSKIINS